MKTDLFSLYLAWFTVPLLHLLNKYVFADWEFVGLLLIIVLCDTATGMWKAWKTGTVSSEGFSKVINKIIAYTFALIAVHVVSFYLTRTAGRLELSILQEAAMYFGSLVYGFLLFRELLSINENLAAVGIKLLPTFVIKRLNNFDETGTYKKE
jgi:toxin secretion/phage lysis holin